MKYKRNIKVILALLFLLITYWPLSSGLFTMKFDMMDWFFPMRFLIGECLQNHVLPVWNPYTNLGYPLHIDPQSGALYPITWIIGYLHGYSLYAINLEFLLHILLAFWGMKKLSEEFGISDTIALLVGLSYACSGFFVGNAQHLTWIISATWLPYILWYYYKLLKNNSWQDCFGLSMFCFLLLTGGYPAFSFTTFYLLLLAFFIKILQLLRARDFSSIRVFLLNNALFTTLFFLQGICFLIFLKEGLPFMIRGETLSLSDAQLLPFSPQSWISFLLPITAGGDPAFYHTDISMANGYFGLFGLLFCLLSLVQGMSVKKGMLWGAGLFFLLVAMGDFAFLHAWLYHYVPMMNLFRYPALFRLFALVCFLLLFGCSLQYFWKGQATNKALKGLQVLLFFAIVFFLIFFIFAYTEGGWRLPETFSKAAMISFLAKCASVDMILIHAPLQVIFLSVLWWISRKRKSSLKKYLPYLIAMDLFVSVQLNAFLTVAEATELSALQEKLDQLPEGFPIPEKNLSAITHQGNGEFLPIWYNNNILKKEVAQDGYNNFKLKNFRDFKADLNHLQILAHPILHWNKADSASTVQIEAFSANYIKARLVSPEPEEIIFLQADYPGWTMRLDGEVTPHYQKHGIFMGATIPAGNHLVEFYFRPRNYLWYLGISFGALTICLVFFLRQIYQAKKLRIRPSD